MVEKKASREDFDREQMYFEEHGSYRDSGAVIGYVKSIEGNEPRKAERLYGSIAHGSLTAAKPDYDVVDSAIGGLRRLGASGEAKYFERQKESKLKAATNVAMMRVGWNTIVRRSVKEGIRAATTGVFIVSILAVVMLSVGRLTGNVIGTAQTSANWSLIIGLVALLSGLFLILNSKKDE